MLWQKSRRSDNVVEDEGGGGGGGGFGGGRGLGLGGIILVVIVSLIFHKNPLEILQLIGGGVGDDGGTAQQQVAPAGNDAQTDFVRAVLGSTEDVWGDMRESQLSGADSACAAAPDQVTSGFSRVRLISCR